MATLLLDHVTVIDGTGAAPLPNAAVLIEGDKLAYVGPTGGLPARPVDRTLDGGGKTALPGLIDLHQHSTFDADLHAYNLRGVTSIRYAGLNQDAVVGVRTRIQRGEIPGPRIFSCGPMLDMAPPAYPHWTRVVGTVEDARREAGRLIRVEGVDALIATQRITPDLLRAIVETAHGLDRPVTGQILATDGRQAAEIGIDGLENTALIFASREWPPERLAEYRSIAHRLAMNGRAWAAIDWDLTAPIIEAMARGGVRYCPTLVVIQACLGDMAPKFERDPLWQMFGEQERGAWQAFQDLISREWSEEDREHWRRGLEHQQEWIRRFRALGGSVVAGTDMQFGALALSVELENLVDCGMSPLEALVAATGEAARALWQAERLGTLRAGRLADVLVLDGDPLADLGALRRVAYAIKGGTLVGA